MEFRFFSSYGKKKLIENDIQKLLKEEKPPCSFTQSFEETHTLKLSQNEIAVTIYGGEEMKKGYVRLEFAEKYHSLPDAKRKIILLHEVIHACQRSNGLSRWDKRSREILRKCDDQRALFIACGGETAKLKIINKNYEWIKRFFSLTLFEMWNNLYFKQNYPHLFETEMEQTYENISQGIDSLDFKNTVKYPIFIEFVRARHLQNITEGYNISSKFEKLCCFWKEKLNAILSNDDQKYFEEWLTVLTDTTSFPDSQTLETKSEEFVVSMERTSRTVFEFTSSIMIFLNYFILLPSTRTDFAGKLVSN